MKILINDYPSIYKYSDNASLKAQKKYLFVVKLDLILMIVGAFLSSVQIDDVYVKQLINILAAFLIGFAFILSIVLKYFRFERTWYGGRAIAESIKSLTWKYMMSARPFNSNEHSDKKLLKFIEEIQEEHKEFCVDLNFVVQEYITEKMKNIRKMSLVERLKFYVEQRITVQREWYSNKAKNNKYEGLKYSWFAIIAQCICLIFSLFLIFYPGFFNTTSILTALVASLFSWMQIKKFQELTQSYAIASNELGMAKEKSKYVNSEKELARFVMDTESAISREHTMWIARRGE